MTGSTGYLRFPHIVGDQLVFTAEDDVWLVEGVNDTIGSARRLTADAVPVSRPRLSPDGATVAWISNRAGEPEAFAMPAGGGAARQLTFFGQPRLGMLGFARDGRLLVCSAAGQPFKANSWAYAIDLSEDGDPTPQLLPYGPVTALVTGLDGQTVVGTGSLQDHAHWKRYRGGTAGRLWQASAGSGNFTELLAEYAGPKTSPVWTAGRLAFLADFEGHGNVYSVDADGTDLRRHTDHESFYARQLAGDGHRLSYQHAGEIWLLDDLRVDSSPRRLPITLGSARSGRARKPIVAAENLGALRVDHSGRASVVEVRGNLVWLAHRNGPARIVAGTPGVRCRLPVVLGSSVGYVSSAEGADAIEIAAADGTTSRFGGGVVGRVLELVAAPDGRSLAAATHDGRVLSITLDGAITELDRNPDGDASGLAFSPDSAWLAYSAAEPVSELHSIRLVELATGNVIALTGCRFEDSSPAFSLDGKYLAFLSARTFDPVYDAQVFDLGFALATRPYLVTLAADTPSPFDPELAGRPATDPETAKSNSGPGEASPVRVDVAGLVDRIVPFPVAAGRLSDLQPVKNGFVWTSKPVSGELGDSRTGDEDVRPSLQRWDFGKRELVELAEHVDLARASGDGAFVVIRDGEALKVLPVQRQGKEGEGTVEVDLGRILLSAEPPAEWAQMLDETARLMAEHYWIEDLSGIDWTREVDKYRPLIERVASRDDVSDLLWEVNGETGSSHAYEEPPEEKKDPLRRPAFLGADLMRDERGRWTIARIVRGDNSSAKARSPLSAPGVDVRPGDELIAVNGRPVGVHGPAELLLGSADKAVELRIGSADKAGEQRSVMVVPLDAELELRYLDWVDQRRHLVHEASDGRIGYLHVPDMASAGWAAFHRDLRVEISRDALILDTRYNGGGHTSQLVVEKLVRRVTGRVTARHLSSSDYPTSAPSGLMVSLANEWAGSDGDIVNAAFQSLELGPVIGTRTWGGVVGIDNRYRLVDGSKVTQPRFSFWFDRFGWSVENYGIEPDQVVEFPPQAWAAGADPQLEAGIGHLLDALTRRPARVLPDLTTRPSRRAPQLPPRPAAEDR
jgi:tricorn protease